VPRLNHGAVRARTAAACGISSPVRRDWHWRNRAYLYTSLHAFVTDVERVTVREVAGEGSQLELEIGTKSGSVSVRLIGRRGKVVRLIDLRHLSRRTRRRRWWRWWAPARCGRAVSASPPPPGAAWGAA